MLRHDKINARITIKLVSQMVGYPHKATQAVAHELYCVRVVTAASCRVVGGSHLAAANPGAATVGMDDKELGLLLQN